MNKIIALTIFLTVFITAKPQKNMIFHDMKDYAVMGTLAPDASQPYSRLPDSLQNVRKKLWDLGQNSAGLSIRFATDATDLSVKWTSLNKFSMNHMSATGVRGIDLYILNPDNTWQFAGSAIPSMKEETTKSIFKGAPKEMREYMMFLPLYDGLNALAVGVNKGATLKKGSVSLPTRDLPVVMYGTSILQGGCATRPGMAHTNILQRMLNREIINLGFSGNGHLDPEIAKLMAQKEASVYVIDVVPNNSANSLNEKLEPFYNILRAAHPTTPILLVENPLFPRTVYDANYRKEIDSLNAALYKFYKKAKDSGDTNLYYFEAEKILDPKSEGTVDGIHLTDLGFQHFAEALYPVLNSLIKK